MEDDDDGSWLEEAEVMSEVHVGCDPRVSSGVSVFAISSFSPSSEADDAKIQEQEGNFVHEEDISEGVDQDPVGTDEHGDLILPRRRRRHGLDEVPGDHICVHHHLSTRLPDVGLQIWKGALLLSDFVLHEMNTSGRFRDAVVIELGSGTGFVGLIMARFARLVFITDRGIDILDNCTRNVVTNSNSLKHGEASVRLRELDWHHDWPPESNGSESNTTYSWTREDIEMCEEASVLLAADVVYSPELTDAFFLLLKKLMPRGCEKLLYLSMEKRYNFSVRDQDVVAHGYKHFRSFFTTDSREQSCGEGSEVLEEDSHGTVRHFKGRRIHIDEIQQYLLNYDRGQDLEIWEIRSKDP